ncbi:MAG: L,D-transpeptidase family protein [Thermoanaerobacteraceae bacterium]|nr:L,D-transpeptidase family protein [Thermoanaerobacteraceae bacterium]
MKRRKVLLYVLLFSLILAIVSPLIIHGEKNNEPKYGILIDANEAKLYLIENNIVIKSYPIAIGKYDTPSPLGYFKIVNKARWGGGFGTRWMGLNVPWGKYGIHGTNKPGSIGWAASHGCFRMKNKDVEDLYSRVHVGTPVVVYGGPYGLLGNGYRKLIPGDRGSHVLAVQIKLKQMGYYTGNLDGIYGAGMEKAVLKFKLDNGLPYNKDITESTYISLGLKLFE